MVNRMTNAKVGGQDYGLADLVSIRQVCPKSCEFRNVQRPILRADNECLVVIF